MYIAAIRQSDPLSNLIEPPECNTSSSLSLPSGLRFSTYLVLALKEIVYQVFELKSITLGNLEQIINKFRKWLFKKC